MGFALLSSIVRPNLFTCGRGVVLLTHFHLVVHIHSLSNHYSYNCENHYCCHHNQFSFLLFVEPPFEAPVKHYPFYNLTFSSAKKVQTSAMKTCFQIAECRSFFCKGNAYFLKNCHKSMTKWWSVGFFWRKSRRKERWVDVSQSVSVVMTFLSDYRANSWENPLVFAKLFVISPTERGNMDK